jgi:hypothetical protein
LFETGGGALPCPDNLAWLAKDKTIAPHIPVFDKPNRTDGTFSRSDFIWEAENDRYICPAGKELKQFRRTYATPRSGITSDGRRLYRASKKDCDGCEIKQRCCPNTVARKDLKLYGTTGLLLDDHGAGSNFLTCDEGSDFDLNKIAASELTVDC